MDSAQGGGFRIIAGFNASLGDQDWLGAGADTGSDSQPSSIGGFTFSCSGTAQGAQPGDPDATDLVGMQAWYLKDLLVENVTTMASETITENNIGPYTINGQTTTPGDSQTAGLLPQANPPI